MTLLLVASAVMGVLWTTAYVCARGQRHFLHIFVIQAGTVFVWPVLAVGSAVMGLNWIYEGIDDPVMDPVVVIVPAGAAVATFIVWMVGVSVAVGFGAHWSGEPKRDGHSI